MTFYDALFDLSTPVLFLLCIGSLLLLACAAALLARALQLLWPSKSGAAMVSTTLSGLITSTALIIAFISNEVWTEAGRAQAAVDREGIAMVESLRVAEHLPPALQTPIESALINYGQMVVREDWPAMDKNSASARTDEALFVLQSKLYEARRASPSATGGPALDALSQHYTTLADAKEMRRVIAKHSVSGIKWTIMLVLLFLSAFALAEFHRNHKRERITALVLFSIAFGSICFLILMYDRPFAGVTTIRPLLVEQALVAKGAS